MSAEIKSHLTELLTRALAKVAPQQPGSLISLERPKQAQHGDFSCPAAMQLARALKRNPRELALELVAALPPSEWLERAEVAGNGFINLRVRPAAKQHIVKTIFADGDRYGRSESAGGRPVIVEFVSANPTGPLHVGHGRNAALGDAIGALLESQGWRVTREFYYNDAGAQIRNLGLSVQARIREKLGVPAEFPADGYHGNYVREIAEKYLRAGNAEGEDLEAVTRFAVAELRREQDLDLQALGVRFDSYFLESSLYTDGRVQKTVQALIDEAGRDAVRFFLLSRKADAEFVFDIDLAKSQSEENPVYYVQYAHARICSVLEQWRTQSGDQDRAFPVAGGLNAADLAPLSGARELALLQRLGEYAEILENAEAELAPHQLVFYLRELAGEFHSYYNAERILVAEAPLRSARLALCLAVRQVLRNGLSLLGVSQPDKM